MTTALLQLDVFSTFISPHLVEHKLMIHRSGGTDVSEALCIKKHKQYARTFLNRARRHQEDEKQ